MTIGTHKSILFVDYENVGKVDLNAIPADVHVPFFFGASQKSVPTDFMRAALKLGPRFVPIDIEGQGTNALDFHIAFYLGNGPKGTDLFPAFGPSRLLSRAKLAEKK